MEMLLGWIYMMVTGAVLVSMATLFLRDNGEKANRIYMVCQGIVVVWCSSQILVLMAKSSLELTLAYLYGNLGICFVGTFWLYFCLLYTGKGIVGWKRYVPMILSLLHYLLVLTNGWHHLYYTEFSTKKVVHGPFFYSNVVVTYVLVILGAVTLYRDMGKSGETEKKTGKRARGLVVASVLVPLSFNAIYMTGLVKSTYDITPLGFAVSLILTMLATVKYQFIDMKKELAITNEKLLLERERNRIAQQVHDTAGHTLTMIKSYMKLVEIAVKEDDRAQAEKYLADAKDLTSRGIRELRESINQLRQEAEYELVTQGVMQLANQVKEIPVEVTVLGEDDERYSHLSKVIYDTTRESITNALKYAEASKIEIVVRFQEKQLQLTIGDDGKGCGDIAENNGIRGIRERIEKAGGTVRFQSAKGEGFLTIVKIPVSS